MAESRPATRTFTQVQAWQKAHAFVLLVYKATKKFPDDERFGLTAQLRRAAVSIPANFAEGYGKRSKAEKLRFMEISRGSIEECRYYTILAGDLGYTKTNRLADALEEASKLLASYAAGLRRSRQSA